MANGEEKIVLQYQVPGDDFTRAGEASADLKARLKRLGFPAAAVRKAAISLYEGEINLAIHAGGGEIRVEVTPERIEMWLDDEGPGIPDIALAMSEGYSTAPDEVRSLGFGESKGSGGEYERMKERISEELKKQFKPEFLNRIDEIIVFHKLTREDAAKVCDLFLSTLIERLGRREIGIDVLPAAKDELLREGYDEVYGARPLRRVIQRRIEDAVSEEILAGKIVPGQKISVDAEGGKIVFRPAP